MTKQNEIADAIGALVSERFADATEVEIRCGTLRAAMRASSRRFKSWRDVFDHFVFEFDQARVGVLLEKA